MTQLQQVKNEIEKRINGYRSVSKKFIPNIGVFDAKIAALIDILSFIDYLEKQEQVKWDDSDMRYEENELLSRFAFYTYKDGPNILYLSNVFVAESFRNKGNGSKILKSAEKVAETLGVTSIRLKVKKDSPANEWYRKNGYDYMTFEGDYDWLEKVLEYPKEQPTIKGWVARDEDESLHLFRSCPKRKSRRGVFESAPGVWSTDKYDMSWERVLDKELFPNFKWEDEPIEVELTIKRV